MSIQLIRRAIDESPAVMVLGNGRNSFFATVADGEDYRRYVSQESFGWMPNSALCFFDMPGLAGFAVLINGEVRGMDQVEHESVAVYYIPLKTGILPRSFRYVLPLDIAGAFHVWSPLYTLLLIEDYPWGQSSNIIGLEQAVKMARASGKALSASVGLLKDYRRYGSTDISGEANAVVCAQREYLKIGVTSDVKVINMEQSLALQISDFIKEKTMYTQDLIAMYTEQLSFKQSRFRKWFDSEWETMGFKLLDPAFNQIFHYEQKFTTCCFGHTWIKRCCDFLTRVIYPDITLLTHEYVGPLIQPGEIEESFCKMNHLFEIALKDILSCNMTTVEDEIDYRLLSQAVRLEVTKRIQEFVNNDMQIIVGQFINHKFEHWFALQEKGRKELDE